MTRLTDEQFDELLHYVPQTYDGLSLEEMPAWMAGQPRGDGEWKHGWLGPDGGVLSLLNELKAERGRVAAVLALHRPGKAHPVCTKPNCPCGGYECCVHCDEHNDRGVPWPCDTYRALTGEQP